MGLIARMRERRESRRAERATLGEFAREYNRLERIAELRPAAIGPVVFIPGFALLIMGSPSPHANFLYILSGVWVMATAVAWVCVSLTPSKADALAADFYRAAGINRSQRFKSTLKPGAKIDSFDHSFPDGRSGKVDVVCDSEGYPMVLFSENQPFTILASQAVPLGSAVQKAPLALNG